MKKITLILCFLLLLLPTTALAHTNMESSSPKEMETVTAPLTEIVLTFNTDIEKLSTFTLLNEEGHQVDVDTKTVEGTILKGAFDDPLPNGEYTVNWKIVGEDGHVIERNFKFKVDMPEQNTDKVAETDAESLSPATPADDSPSKPANESPDEEPSVQTPVQSSSNSNNPVIWIGAGVLVLVIILGLALRRRK